mmetsp:Transcript_58501/g.63166  ORF Transcript_58501/g.63166 Transcript_58501/m.63166 type:complete len:82 (-) Transcript_58501:90-335(-)
MSEYDEYQEAWRLLGFMVDCNSNTDDDGNSGSGSEDVTEDGCTRYVCMGCGTLRCNVECYFEFEFVFYLSVPTKDWDRSLG